MHSTGQTSRQASHPVQPSAWITARIFGITFRGLPARDAAAMTSHPGGMGPDRRTAVGPGDQRGPTPRITYPAGPENVATPRFGRQTESQSIMIIVVSRERVKPWAGERLTNLKRGRGIILAIGHEIDPAHRDDG